LPYCTSCGKEIPERQGKSCSMCYGDMNYGSDGYYQRRYEEYERKEEEKEAQWQEAMEELMWGEAMEFKKNKRMVNYMVGEISRLKNELAEVENKIEHYNDSIEFEQEIFGIISKLYTPEISDKEYYFLSHGKELYQRELELIQNRNHIDLLLKRKKELNKIIEVLQKSLTIYKKEFANEENISA